MDLFGVGPAEIVLILIVVMLIFGPDQLPEIAKKLGQMTREVRRTLNDFDVEMKETVRPFRELDLKPGAQPDSLPPPSTESNSVGSPDTSNLIVGEPPASDGTPPPTNGEDSVSPSE